MGYRLLDIVAVQEPLKKLYETPMEIGDADRMLKGIIEIDAILKNFDKEKKKVFIDYGDEQGDGTYLVSDENEEEFQKRMDELFEQEFELECFPITFVGGSSFKISPSMLKLMAERDFFYVIR